MPCASSARCVNAVTEPLPLVPAMCSDAKLRSGWPSAAHNVCIFCRPSLIPKFSSANRRSRDKGRWDDVSGFGAQGTDTARNGSHQARLVTHEAEGAGERVLQLAPVDDQVQHPMFDEE